LAWFILLLTLASASAAQTPRQLVVGLDHIPVVVADLQKAEADFRAMGFAIKSGHVHPDVIRNVHVKFPDGTEIELITAPAAVDALTAEYRAKLRSGEGPVYFGLYAPDHPSLIARLNASGLPLREDGATLDFPPETALHPLFFGSRNRTPTDRPEHFAHPNSAVRLSAVWIRDTPALHTLFRDLGISVQPVSLCNPILARKGSMALLAEGRVYLVPSASENVIAARVEVRSLETLKSVLSKNHVQMQPADPCEPGAVWVSPPSAHGIWLEFAGPQR